MASDVEICNLALTTYLGQSRITALSEKTQAAQMCSIHLEGVIESCLARNWWTFARKREAIAQLENDRSEWQYCYQMPADCLALHWVNDADVARLQLSRGISPDIDREIVGRRIYCDVPMAVAQFTRKIDDPTEFPRYFVDALAASLAAAIAYPITQDRGIVQRSGDAAVDLINVAIAMDARNEPPIQASATPSWLRDRGVY